MTKITSIAAYLVRKLWLLLAILLVVFALILSAARYALPHVEHKKHLIEDYINERYGVSLSIGSVHAVWQSTGPSIVLNSVSLQQDEASPVALDIRQIYVELDFWQSLAQQLISSPRFELRGLKLHIDADRLGGKGKNNFPVVSALESLFLEQLQSFSLEDGIVSVTQNQDVNSFDVARLTWNNRENRHQGLGEIRVAELASNSASFIIDIQGSKEDFDGVFYAKADDLDISPWVSDLIKTKRPLTKSRANFEIWANLDSDAIQSIQVELDNSLLEWGGDNYSPLVTGVTGGSIQALPHENGWNLRVDQLKVNSSDETLVTDLIGRVEQGGDLLLNTVKPVQINPFLMLAPLFMDDTSDEEIRTLDPKGQIATLQLLVRNRGLELAAKVLDLSWSQSSRVPGLSGIDADIYWYKNAGAFYFESKDTTLFTDNLIQQNLAINQFNADVFVYKAQVDESEHWLLSASDIVFDTDKVVLNPSFSVDLTSTMVEAYVNVSPRKLDGINALFPTGGKVKNTFKYLDRAFTGVGNVTNAQLLWRGKPQDYPFTDNSGIFQAYVDITASEFAFSTAWPSLTDLDLSLYFVNDALVMESPKGKLGGLNISEMSAAIPRLHPSSSLTIYAQGEGSGESLTSIMTQSSLSASLGKLLDKDVKVSGPLTAKLKLDIPLTKGKQVRAKGEATLSDNDVYITSTKMRFKEASGAVAFDNASIDATNLTARVLSQPVSLSFTGRQKEHYELDVNMQGMWHVHPLVKTVNERFVDYLDGESKWNLDVSLAFSKSDFSYQAQLDADLAATHSLMPAPFNTSEGSPLPLSIHSKGNLNASTIDATLGDQIRFDGVLPHKEMQFSRAHLALGNPEPITVGTGFSIAAQLPDADGISWFNTLHTLLSPQDKDKGRTQNSNATEAAPKRVLFPSPSRIFVTAETFTLAGHSFDNVVMTAKQQSNDWLMNIDASDMRGTLRIHSDVMEQGIDIHADYLRVTKPPTAESHDTEGLVTTNTPKQGIDPLDIPPLYFSCQRCDVYGVDLGEVILDTAKTAHGLRVRQLVTRSDDAQLNATGMWARDSNNTITTQLTGKITSPDVGAMLKQFDVSSGIKDSGADIDFDLAWPNSPFDFSLVDVNGDIAWSLSDGYLTELSDKGSRILTLFSLNSLVRKLSLDFRDVFAKGFFYDDMSGTVQIADGRAFTQDTEIDGGAGEIEINGYTELDTGKLNYNVSFAPNVTGNLPFLVYFLATPPTALAALALDQVLTSAKVISNVNYKVTGTISEPQFDEVERNSKDISLPANNVPATEPLEDRPLTKEDVQRLKMEVIDG